MRLQGRIWKDGRMWLAEVPLLDGMTQGYSRKDVYAMVKDWVETMVDKKGFRATVIPLKNGLFELDSNENAALVALMLRRMREKKGVSLAEAAKRLGATSKNTYARYERGSVTPSVTKLFELLDAIAPDEDFLLVGHPKAA